MYRGKNILPDEPLGHDDGVLEVVPVPRQECAQHIGAQSQIASIGGAAVCKHIACLHTVAQAHQRLLVDADILVGDLELDQLVDIIIEKIDHFGAARLPALHNDPLGTDIADNARVPRGDHGLGIHGHAVFHARSHQRRIGLEQRHALALHIGAHQRAVRVIMFQEGYEGGRGAHQLARRHIHIVDVVRGYERVVVAATCLIRHVGKTPVLVQWRVRLCDRVLVFLVCGKVLDIVGDPPVLDQPVRSLQKAQGVDDRVGGNIGDQADVRAFRRLDRADPAIVSVMHIPDLEPGAIPGEATRSQGRQAPLV